MQTLSFGLEGVLLYLLRTPLVHECTGQYKRFNAASQTCLCLQALLLQAQN